MPVPGENVRGLRMPSIRTAQRHHIALPPVADYGERTVLPRSRRPNQKNLIGMVGAGNVTNREKWLEKMRALGHEGK